MSNKAELITRIAPSPTGHLHLGHAFHLYMIEKSLHNCGASTVFFRAENHDAQRSKAKYNNLIRAELKWFSPELVLTECPSHQQRKPHYLKELLDLKENLFWCDCNKSMGFKDPAGAWTCSSKCKPNGPSTQELKSLKLFSGTKLSRNLRIHLVINGQNYFPIVVDKLSNGSYLLCNTIDDRDQNINLIIRGEDFTLLNPVQKGLHDLLKNKTKIQRFHHPLLLESGRKLSKRQKDESLTSLKDQGFNPQEIKAFFEELILDSSHD